MSLREFRKFYDRLYEVFVTILNILLGLMHTRVIQKLMQLGDFLGSS